MQHPVIFLYLFQVIYQLDVLRREPHCWSDESSEPTFDIRFFQYIFPFFLIALK